MTNYPKRRRMHRVGADIAVTSDMAAAFGKKLRELLDKKGWIQRDLATQATLFLPKDSGIEQITEDNVSRYVNGRSIPRGERMSAIVQALGTTATELFAPEPVTEMPEEAATGLYDLGSGRVWLRINQECDWNTGLKILAILKGEEKG